VDKASWKTAEKNVKNADSQCRQSVLTFGFLPTVVLESAFPESVLWKTFRFFENLLDRMPEYVMENQHGVKSQGFQCQAALFLYHP
jgi:hypothetical protein